MPPFHCNACDKTFSRTAHLQRHRESQHGGSERWDCDFCKKSYARRDALNRHLTNCKLAANGARLNTRRVNKACKACSEHKVKCSRGQPCNRCEESAIECHYMLHGSSQPASFPPESGAMANVESLPSPNSQDISSESNSHATTSASNEDSMSNTILAVGMTQDYTDPWLSWTWTEPMWSALSPLEFPDAALESEVCFPPAEETVDLLESQSSVGFNSEGLGGGADSAVAGQPDISRTIFAKVDPLEFHRQAILTYLRQDSCLRSRTSSLLDRNRFAWLLKLYFTRHHRHTPIIHLHTFNIVDCPTSLIWAIALIGASYVAPAGICASDSLALAKLAYQFTLETDQGLLTDGRTSLEGLQALLLLSILDRLMVKRSGCNETFCIDLPQIVRLARDAGVFMEPEISVTSWHTWALSEARRRLGLIIFAFDMFTSVLHDILPNVSREEMELGWPYPEPMFTAPNEAAWLHWRERMAAVQNPWPVNMTIAALLCGTSTSQAIQLPDTLMGRFTALHCIIQHAWRSKRILLTSALYLNPSAFEPYSSHVQQIVTTALKRWQSGWPDALLDYDKRDRSSPSLYHDRADACFFLAGILARPGTEIAINHPRSSEKTSPHRLGIPQLLERLMILCDRNRVDRSTWSFDAVYQQVLCMQDGNADQSPISQLLYRESDTTTTGFAS